MGNNIEGPEDRETQTHNDYYESPDQLNYYPPVCT